MRLRTRGAVPHVRLFRLASALLALGASAQIRDATRTVNSSPDDRPITDSRSLTSAVNAAARPIPVEDALSTRSVSEPAWSPDGQQIVFTSDISGHRNLWKVRASGGWPIQLTRSDDAQSGAAWSPDGDWIVYQQDRGGKELSDLYAVPSAGGEALNLTNSPDIDESNARWSPDGKTLAFRYKPKTSAVYDLALLDWPTRKLTVLTHEATKDHSWNIDAWSPDGKTIYANRNKLGYTDFDVYRISISTGESQNLTPHQGEATFTASSLSPDGRTLLVTSNSKNGFQNVALLDVSTKALTWVTDTKWEARSGDFSPKGVSFTYTVNADGRRDVYLVGRAAGRAEKIAMPDGLNEFAGKPTSFSPNGAQMIVSHQSSNKPPDLWVYAPASRKAYQLTFSSIASIAAVPSPPSRLVHYKSFDGTIISALVWVPFGLKRDGSHPAIVFAHGGPASQTLDGWAADIGTFVSRGYVCIAPNVRGSTGYGIAFQRANYQDLGGGDLQDEIYAGRFLIDSGYVDPKRIGIVGASYGGFMALMAIGKTPEFWAAAIDIFGIVDWRTLMQHAEPLYQESVKSLLGDPIKDRAIYEKCSPITYLIDAKAPLLIFQGENDPRVPTEETEQAVGILKRNGRVVEEHRYRDMGHGFNNRENAIDSLKRSIEWFDKYLKSSH